MMLNNVLSVYWLRLDVICNRISIFDCILYYMYHKVIIVVEHPELILKVYQPNLYYILNPLKYWLKHFIYELSRFVTIFVQKGSKLKLRRRYFIWLLSMHYICACLVNISKHHIHLLINIHTISNIIYSYNTNSEQTIILKYNKIQFKNT